MTTWNHRQPTSNRTGQPYLSDDLEDEDDYYDTKSHTSAIRYAPRQGNGSIVYGPPPIRRKSRYTANQPAPVQAKRHVHWLVYVGLLFTVGIIGWLAITILGAWWQAKQDDWTYGMPRTYQTDAVAGHGDSASHPSHFIAQNLNGEIVVIEYPTSAAVCPAFTREYVGNASPLQHAHSE